MTLCENCHFELLDSVHFWTAKGVCVVYTDVKAVSIGKLPGIDWIHEVTEDGRR